MGEEKTGKKVLMRVQHLSKTFLLGETEVQALRDVSFEIYQGELIVILGPSGSGKSTMLNIIGGLETATSGQVFYQQTALHETDRKQLTKYRRDHVGFIFQFYNLIPNLNALENVAIVSEMAAAPLDPLEMLRLVGLEDRALHYPGKLSGGQQQRVAIAERRRQQRGRGFLQQHHSTGPECCGQPTATRAAVGFIVGALYRNCQHQWYCDTGAGWRACDRDFRSTESLSSL